VLSSSGHEDSSQQQLGEPLLLSSRAEVASEETQHDGIGAGTGGGGGIVSAVRASMPVDHYHHSPTVRRLLSIQCMADRLPWIFYVIVTNGKITAVGLVALYLIVVSLWIPFWLLAKCITEWGVYFLAASGIFLAGRGIIRLIAFPGASQKMVADIEEEFAKYSVRMIVSATSSIIDLATVFIPEPGTEPKLNSRALYHVPTLWQRCKMYRDRVLGVYLEVLTYMYQQESLSSLVLSTEVPTSSDATDFGSSYGPGFTRYGNNRFSGDIGSANFLTVRCESLFILSNYFCQTKTPLNTPGKCTNRWTRTSGSSPASNEANR
jgi:hypothetical protein